MFAVTAIMLTSILLPAKLEANTAGGGAFDVTWLVVITPVLFLFALIFCKLTYLAINDCMWSSRQRMKLEDNLQRTTVFVYLLSICIVGWSGIYLAIMADAGSDTNVVIVSITLSLGCFIFATMVTINTAWRARESIYDLGAHALPGAETKEIRIGRESWTALGRVHVNFGGSEEAGNPCLQCTDYICGARRTCFGTSARRRLSFGVTGTGSAAAGVAGSNGGEFGEGANEDKVF